MNPSRWKLCHLDMLIAPISSKKSMVTKSSAYINKHFEERNKLFFVVNKENDENEHIFT